MLVQNRKSFSRLFWIAAVVAVFGSPMLCSVSALGADDPPATPKPKADPPKKTDSPLDEATAKKNFAADYEAGVAAVADKNWTLARQKFGSALKALGEYNDPKKSTATVLLNKAERILIGEDAMFTAGELMRLKQWVEAEEAYRKVMEVRGVTERVNNLILDCRAGLEADNAELKAANDLLKEKKWKEATEAFNKASDKVGGIRAIQEGLNKAKLGAEADPLLKQAADLLEKKQWNEAFELYKKINQMVGDTDEVKAGIAAAQAGYAAAQKAKEAEPKAP